MRLFEIKPLLLSKNVENERSMEKIDKSSILKIKCGEFSNMLMEHYKKEFESRASTDFYGFNISAKLTIKDGLEKFVGNTAIYTEDSELNALNSEFKYIRLETMDYFLDKLKEMPIPFVFIPTENLVSTRRFFKTLSMGEDYVSSVFLFSCAEGKEIILMDPNVAEHLGLGYILDDLITDNNIISLFLGFVAGK